MEKPAPPRPPGHRIYTRKMLEALAQPPEIPPGITRGRAVEALRRAALELRLSHSAVALVTHLAMLTEEADWRPGTRPIAWPSNVEFRAELELSKAQISTLVRIAIEEGLLAVESGPGGKRFGRRNAAGDIIEAFGFNLCPTNGCRRRWPTCSACPSARAG